MKISQNDIAEDENFDIDELYSLLDKPTSSLNDEFEAEIHIDDAMQLTDGMGAVSDNISVLEELGALLGKHEPAMYSVEDETERVSQIEEDYYVEEHVDDISALDELKNFLDETSSSESSESDDSISSNYEYSAESRRSILDEIQDLLQSSIDELKHVADGNLVSSLLSAEADYPTRNELKNLLENKLSQLMMISDGSVSIDSDGCSSVLDELKSLLGKTDSDTDIYMPLSKVDDLPDDEAIIAVEEIDGYVLAADEGSVSDDVIGDSVLKEFEYLLPEIGEITDSGVKQEVLITSEITPNHDDKVEVAAKDTSILEELEAYFGVSSELGDADYQDIGTEVSVRETETDTILESSDSAAKALEQLESMLAETAGSDNNEISENVKADEDDFIFQEESSYLTVENKEEINNDTARLRDDVQPAGTQTDSLKKKLSVEEVNRSPEIENNKRLPLVAIILLVSGVIAFWHFSYNDDGVEDRLQLTQSKSTEKSVVEKKGSEVITQVETGAVASANPAEIDNIDDLLASIESSRYGKKPLYEDESYEVPVQSYTDKSLSDEPDKSRAEIDVTQMPEREVSNVIKDDRLQDTINKQLIDFHGDSEESIKLLNERMTEAESSLSKLQLALERSDQLEAEYRTQQMQDKTEENVVVIANRESEPEFSVPESQFLLDKPAQLEPVQSVSSLASKINARHLSQESVSTVKDQTFNIWSVHLLAYYGKPPPAAELEFLNIAGVPYEIEPAMVNDGVWYRVLVNNSSEYGEAKEYAAMLKKRLAIKKIWISKKQYAYD